MIDLHLHTNNSDGLDSTEQLLTNAQDNHLSIISITDHDSINAYLDIEKNPSIRDNFKGKIIPGCELKTHYKGISIEVLAYGIDYKKLKIKEYDQQTIQSNILKKYIDIVDKLNFKYDIEELFIDVTRPDKQYSSFVLSKELLKHPENKELIEQIGTFDETSFFRVHQCNKESIFYVDETEDLLELNEVINNIHEAGGLSFIAHFWVYPYQNKEETLEQILKETKIDGVECIYPLFTKEQIDITKKLCQKYNKYLSGGSDYHAGNKPTVKMGTGIDNNISIDEDLITPWLDKIKTI